MEEGLSRRRRLVAEERGEFLDHNPVAEDLPSETDGGLGRRIREPERARSGVDSEQMAMMEPAYDAGLPSDVPETTATGIERETGLGMPRRENEAEELELHGPSGGASNNFVE